MKPAAAAPSSAASAAQVAVRRFEYAQLQAEPWANGNGITRTIARGSAAGHGEDTDWRVSLATLNTSARFSQFAGFERTFVLLDEGAVKLRSQEVRIDAQRGQPVHFSGDLDLWSTLSTAPVNALNVMTRRGRCGSSVSVLSGSSSIAAAPIRLLIGLSGQWSVRGGMLDGVLLGPLQGILIERSREPLDLVPLGAGAELISIAIVPLSL
ncbi:HutD family protein [Paraburkholderia sp. Ac-20342]|uniref:HutD/Ves family protein n=1 Tax=Paraburkholderia sp. Ac-20342 TaxID=2703889 RepID=UPI001980D4D7|nr:HutD family protein [Paraburkholderia sp. Ac-20342]MBN3849511.1 HutD family protein [Paraburkholderia sp. Ac-20342]